jgi:hypothetical protein
MADPPYSPALATADFWLFLNSSVLKGKCFLDIEDIKSSGKKFERHSCSEGARIEQSV